MLWHCCVGGRKGIRPVEKTEWWVADMVISLERGADLHMAQLMPLLLTVSCFSKIDIGLPFWYRLTRVVPDKGPLNGCVCYWHLIKWMLRPLCLFCLTSVLLIISTNEVNIIIILVPVRLIQHLIAKQPVMNYTVKWQKKKFLSPVLQVVDVCRLWSDNQMCGNTRP